MKVKQYRLAFGISQEEMGKELGISTRSYQRKERGEHEFTLKEFRQCYKVFTKYDSKINAGEFFLKA